MKANRSRYLLVALLAFVAVYHAFFWRDVWRDFTFNYPYPGFWVEAPWPTVSYVEKEVQGLRVGDRIVSVDGRALNGQSDLLGAARQKQVGDTIQVEAVRDGRTQSHTITLRSVRRNAIGWLVYTFAVVMFVLMPAVCLSLGFAVAAIRPRDPMAWLLLLMMISLSQFSVGNVSIMGWPDWIRLPSHLYRELALVWPVCLIVFGIYFAERWSVDRRFPWLKWIFIAPLLILGSLVSVASIGMSEAFGAVEWLVPLRSQVQTPYRMLAMLGVSLFFFAVGWKSGHPEVKPDARRRLKLVLWGTFLSMTPLLILLLYTVRFGYKDNIWSALAIMMTLLFPLTLAYVIVVHKAMDVRVAVRQGVQYAFAQRGLVVLQAIVSGLVILGVAVYFGSGANVWQRIVAVLAAVAAIFFVRTFAARIAHWVDRRFFRESYNTDAILSELSEDVRTMVETKPLLQTVADRLASTLHVPQVAMMIAANGKFEPAYATGSDGLTSIRFSQQAGTVAQLEREKKPVRLYLEDEGCWVHRAEVSEDERRCLSALDSQLLLPLTARDKLLGFVSLGRKRSEEPFSPTDVRMLRSVASQTGLALENSRLTASVAHEMAQRQMLDREIEIAREVQQRLFPQSRPEVEGLEYTGMCRPAQGVGGDYYDFLELPEGRFGLAIGDVSGKGIPAALLMASLQASLRGQTLRGVSDLADLMASVNRMIFDVTPANRYATFFYSQYTPATHTLQYVNAGHNTPIILRGEEVIGLETGGPVVGLFRPARYEEGFVKLQPGDLLVLFTDGISEAMNHVGEEWGEDNLAAAAAANKQLPVDQLMNELIAGADAFADGAPQHDDMTVVVVRVSS